MMPRDTNAWGTIFGGIILSYIDQAGAVEANEMGCARVVTVAMEKVEFHQPVHVGDLVSFYTHRLRVGRTSITVKVIVEAQRRLQPGEPLLVTEAEVTYVNVDDSGRPTPISDTE
jgi:acyl-CoA thioesterase YciA